MILTPHDYQAVAIAFGVCTPRALLLGDPGVGKTIITLATFRAMKRLGLAERCLLFAPLRVANQVWRQESDLWDCFRDLKIIVATGDENRRLRLLAEEADIYIVSTDSAQWFRDLRDGKRKTEVKKKKKKLEDATAHIVKYRDDADETKEDKKLLGQLSRVNTLWNKLADFELPKLDLLVVDEIGKFRNSNSTRSRAMLSIAQKFSRRIGLTGTLRPKSLDSLHTVYRILDDGERLGKTKKSYHERWFSEERKQYGTNVQFSEWHPLPGATESIAKEVADITLRLDAEDLLDMPPKLEVVHFVDMPPKARKIYEQMEEKLYAEIDGSEVFSDSASGKYRACLQIANGGIYAEDAEDLFKQKKKGREVHEIHESKVALVEEIADTLEGRPLFVLYNFRHDLPRLRKALGKIPAINGDTSEKEDAEILRAWNASEIPILAAQFEAISHGLNMQKGDCRDVFCFGLPDDYEVFDQAIRRVYRQGVGSKVRIHIGLARNTVEADVLSSTHRKEAGQRALFQAFKDLAKGRK